MIQDFLVYLCLVDIRLHHAFRKLKVDHFAYFVEQNKSLTLLMNKPDAKIIRTYISKRVLFL